MSARILIVDDLAPNLKLLKVKLTAHYYDVLEATNGKEAIEIAERERPDLILLDAMMPGMNGFEVCAHLKAGSATWHIPIVMVTALEETKDRIRGLEAGADDFITKPIEDFNLMARVKSLLRLKMVTDQLMGHADHDANGSKSFLDNLDQRRGHILMVDDHQQKMQILADALGSTHKISMQTDSATALTTAQHGVDLILVSLVSGKFDGLRLCASLRSNPATRELPILVIGDPEHEAKLVRAYDLGVNDTLMRPVERQELRARIGTQLKRKFYADSLKDTFNESLEMVVTDPLTGLGNRRYFDRAVAPLLSELAEKNTPFSLAVFDIDHFKRVNDILGHDIGDCILKEVAVRLASNIRAIDILSRYGGEEFIIAMPDTGEAAAHQAADRVRGLLGGTPIIIDGQAFNVTVSVGITEAGQGDKFRDIFRRADDALYRAKQNGRDQVCANPQKNAA